MTTLAYTRTGTGDPLVLLHGIGSSRKSWEPVVPALADRFDVIAVDLPGFGDSAPLPPQVEPEPAALARSVAGLLDELHVGSPHIAGNSLGGWVALELAGIRPAASVALLSPAGLWPGRTPLYSRTSLRAIRWMCRHAAGLLHRLVNGRLGRVVVLGQVVGAPSRVPPDRARAMIDDMGRAPGFDATLRATDRRQYRSGTPIDAPVSVAFGSRDRILLAHRSRRLDQLPADTHVGALPRCGHVPMNDDPDAVLALIASSTGRARRLDEPTVQATG